MLADSLAGWSVATKSVKAVKFNESAIRVLSLLGRVRIWR